MDTEMCRTPFTNTHRITTRKASTSQGSKSAILLPLDHFVNKLPIASRPLDHTNLPFCKIKGLPGHQLWGTVMGMDLTISNMTSLIPTQHIIPKIVMAVMKCIIHESTKIRIPIPGFNGTTAKIATVEPHNNGNNGLEGLEEGDILFVPVRIKIKQYILLLANPATGAVAVYNPMSHTSSSHATFINESTNPEIVHYIKILESKLGTLYNNTNFWTKDIGDGMTDRSCWPSVTSPQNAIPPQLNPAESGVCILLFLEIVVGRVTQVAKTEDGEPIWFGKKDYGKRMDLNRSRFFHHLEKKVIDPPPERPPPRAKKTTTVTSMCTNCNDFNDDNDNQPSSTIRYDQGIWGYMDNTSHGKIILTEGDIASLDTDNWLNENIIDAKLMVAQLKANQYPTRLQFIYISTTMMKHIIKHDGLNLQTKFGRKIKRELQQMLNNKIAIFCINAESKLLTRRNNSPFLQYSGCHWNIVTANYITKTLTIFDPMKTNGECVSLGPVTPTTCWTNPVCVLQCIRNAIIHGLEENVSDWNGELGQNWPCGLEYESFDLLSSPPTCLNDNDTWQVLSCLYVDGLIMQKDFSLHFIEQFCCTNESIRDMASLELRQEILNDFEAFFIKL